MGERRRLGLWFEYVHGELRTLPMDGFEIGGAGFSALMEAAGVRIENVVVLGVENWKGWISVSELVLLIACFVL